MDSSSNHFNFVSITQNNNDVSIYNIPRRDCKMTSYTTLTTSAATTSCAADTMKQQDRRTLQPGMYMSEMTFPSKLFQFLTDVDEFNLSHVASWQPHGRCFRIHDPKAFVMITEPSWFVYKKYSSFQRQLNMYGFHRIAMGPDKNGYCHPHFIRNRHDLVRRIIRIPLKKNDPSRLSIPAASLNLDFYSTGIVPSNNRLPIENVNNNVSLAQHQDYRSDVNFNQHAKDTPSAFPPSINHGSAQVIDTLRSLIHNPTTSNTALSRSLSSATSPFRIDTSPTLSILQRLEDYVSSQLSSPTISPAPIATSSLQQNYSDSTSIAAILPSAVVSNATTSVVSHRSNDLIHLIRHALLSQQLPEVPNNRTSISNNSIWNASSMFLQSPVMMASVPSTADEDHQQQQWLQQLPSQHEQLVQQIMNLLSYRRHHHQQRQQQAVEFMEHNPPRTMQQRYAPLGTPGLGDYLTSLQQQPPMLNHPNHRNMSHTFTATSTATAGQLPSFDAINEAALAPISITREQLHPNITSSIIDNRTGSTLMNIILAALNDNANDNDFRSEGDKNNANVPR